MIRKLISYSSISLLTFWAISPILLYVFGIEFNNEDFEYTFKEIRFWGVPSCIFLSLFCTIRLEDEIGNRTIKILFALGASFFAFVLMVLVLFAGMCNWINRETLFISKEDKNVKIIERAYGCGAYDSDPPTIKNFIIQERFKYFISATEINVDDIDKEKWMKTSN